uniref:Uncharacterized protein n=1 Tax=uncultured Candidatus Melainabacteria bacterium TaxID=2682970 RepID=A0A650EL80_9BACT|nr:hypothetical protein Melaina855_0810 [uncultured Candidatus Melainabacteria bacterium]
MVKLISDTSTNFQTRGYNSSFVTMMLERPQKSQADNVVNKDDNKIKKYTLPAGLLAGGGVLVYLGLMRPGKSKLFNMHIRNHIFNMEKKVHEFVAFIRNSIDDISGESTTYINNYKAAHHINPVEYSSSLKVFRRAEKVAEAQDLAFEAITSRTNFGMDDIQNFSSMYNTIKNSSLLSIGQKKAQAKTAIGENVKVNLPKNLAKNMDLVEEGENQLITMQNALSEQLDGIEATRMGIASRQLHSQMAQAITESRRLQYQAKENVINTAFYQTKKLLNLPEEFGPSYLNVPKVSDFDEKLAYMELRPINVPPRLKEIYEDNNFFRIAIEHDFTDLPEREVVNIFYSSSADNNLKDLGYLIDRLRLRQAILKTKNNDRKSVYDVMIPKLEYLSARLNDFGKRELLTRCGTDFDKMTVSERKNTLKGIYDIASRLGFESISHMDAVLAKESSNYSGMNIRNYMEIFRNNPDIYFF